MSKLTKKILLALFILATAVVLAGGLVLLVWQRTHEPTEKTVPTVVDPVAVAEKIYDPDIAKAGKNYTENFNVDHLLERNYYPASVEYMKDDGTYAPVDTTVKESSKDGFAYLNDTNTYRSYFKNETGTAATVKFEVAGRRAAVVSLEGASKSTAKVVENTVTYAGVYDGIDARYTVTSDTLIEELVVSKKPEQDSFAHRVTLSGAYYKLRDDGSLTFHDPVSHNIVFTAPPPLMYEEAAGQPGELYTDSSADSGMSRGIRYEIIEDGNDVIITKVLTEEGKQWLESAHYPVVIDITIQEYQWSTNMNGHVWRECVPADCAGGNCCTSYNWFIDFISNASLTSTRVEKYWGRDLSYSRDAITGRARTFVYFVGDYQTRADEDITSVKLRISGYPTSTGSLWWMPADCPKVEILSHQSSYYSSLDTTTQWYDKITTMSTQPVGSPGSLDAVINFADLNTTRANWNATYCNNNPATCTIESNLSTAQVGGTYGLSVGLRENQVCHNGHVNETNWHGSRVFTTRHTNTSLWPRLTVLIRPRPVPTVIAPTCAQSTSLTVEWYDTTDDESGWEIQRDTASGFTAPTSFTIPTGVTGSCGTNCTQTCNTTVAGYNNGTKCSVTLLGLLSDRRHYFRVRSTHTVAPATPGNWSVSANEYTRAATWPGPIRMQVGSSRYDRLDINVTGGGSWYLLNPNQNTTNHNIALWGYWNEGTLNWEERFNNTVTVANPSTASPFDFATNEGSGCYRYDTAYRPLTLDMSTDWLAVYYLGGSGTLRMSGSAQNAFMPNEPYFATWAPRDSRPGTQYTKIPTGNPFLSDQWTGSYTRSRDPSPPTIGTKTATTIQVTMNTAPYSLPSTPANPASTDYAMSITRISDGNTRWFGDTSSLQEFTGSMPLLPDFGTPDRWAVNNPRTVDYLTPATCYRFRAISINDNFGLFPPQPSLVGEDVSWGFPTLASPLTYPPGPVEMSTTNFPETLWAAGYPSVVACTPLYIPTNPTIACNYSTARGYYCDTTFNDATLNPPTSYYKYQYSTDNVNWVNIRPYNNTTGLQYGADWNQIPDGTSLSFRTLACSANNRYIRLSANTGPADTNESAYTSSATDTLPPCKPGTPSLSSKTINVINWTWVPSIKNISETISHVKYRDNGGAETNFIGPNPPQGLSSLTPNTGHIISIKSCDRNELRCGEFSSNSINIYTYADIPAISTVCGLLTTPSINYFCDISMVNHGSNTIPSAGLSYALNNSNLFRYWGGVSFNSIPQLFLPAYASPWPSRPPNYTGLITRHNLLNSACATRYSYYMYARNSSNETSPTSYLTSDWTFPCVPVLDYSDRQPTSITWRWTIPSGIPVGYKFYNATTNTEIVLSPAPTCDGGICTWTEVSLGINTQYSRQVSAIDIRGDEGPKSNIASVYTAAAVPTISANCTYNGTGCNSGRNVCALTIGQNGNQGAGTPVNYYLTVDGAQGAELPVLCQGWRTYSYLNDNNCFNVGTSTILTCGRSYTLGIKAKNTADLETTTATAIRSTAACGPTAPTHNIQSMTSFRWQWGAVGGATAYRLYREGVATALYNGLNLFFDDQGLSANTQYGVCVRAVIGGVESVPSSISRWYTSIQPVDSITFTTWQNNFLLFRSFNTPSNLGSGTSGLRFQGAGGTSFASDWKQNNDSVSHSGLLPNQQYCYQGQTRNGNSDQNLFYPDPPQCTYTFAVTPDRPAIKTATDGESVHLVLRTADDNNPNYTRYAICVSQYDSLTGNNISKYVLNDDDNNGLVYVDWGCSDPTCTTQATCEGSGVGECNATWDPNTPNCAEGNDNIDNKYWGTRDPGFAMSDWNSTAGITIAIDPSQKYDFKAKARNENSGGAINGENWTNFGPPATLFLVKNNIVGWAWSSNVGWISLNCLNLFTEPSLGYSCGVADDWGVNTNFEPTREINPIEGYAWAASGLHIHDWLTGGINKTGVSSFSKHYNNSKTDMVLDSQGNPHIVWSEYDSTSNSYDIYYLRKINNVWQTANGTTYIPNAINTITSGLNVSSIAIDNNSSLPNSSTLDSLWPSLALDDNDIPHIAWNEGGWTEIEWAHQQIYYTYWNGATWQQASQVDALDAGCTTYDSCNGGSTPSLKLSNTNQPYVAFMNGWYNYGTNIYVRKLVGAVWTDVDALDGNNSDDVNVSQTKLGQIGGGYSNSGSMYPDLELDTANNPHVAWRQSTMDGPDPDTEEDVHVYYKKWNGSAWVSVSNNGEANVCSTNFANTTTGCISGSEQITCGWFCNDNAPVNPGGGCTDNTQCGGGYMGTCEHNQCVKQNLSVNADVYQLGITSDPDGFDLNTTSVGKGAPDLALYADDTPGILFNDSYYFTLFRKWNGSDWVDVDDDADPNNNVWINKKDVNDNHRFSSESSNYSLSMVDDVPYITWTDRDKNENYNDIMVRFWNINVNAGAGAWTTVSGDYGGGANYDDNKLTPYDIENTHSSNSEIAVDPDGNIHVAWSEIVSDNISDCSSDADCTNPLYDKCYDYRCTRTCTNKSDCVNSLYPQCIDRWPDWFCGSSEIMYSLWEKEPNKSGLGWISFNKYVCANDTQQGCSAIANPSNECEGNACVDSANETPGAVSYGYCYVDDTAVAKKFGFCSTDEVTYCMEDNVSGCPDAINARCVLEACQTGDVCSNYDGGAVVEDCRLTATANFSGESREIEGWARILSAKEQGERYAPQLTDWGWIKLSGTYETPSGELGEYNLAGTEIDSQLFLQDPDVSTDSLALYTLLGWGWNAEITNYNSLSKWLDPYNVSKSGSANYVYNGSWSDTSLVVDDVGDTHLAWSEYNPQNDKYDIFYAKLEGGVWKTASGQEYRPQDSDFDRNASNLDVSYSIGLSGEGNHSRSPSLALDSDNNPHIAAQYQNVYSGGDASESSSTIFYTYWNGTAWQAYTEVQSPAAQAPSLALDDNNIPYITYRYGQYWPSDIYLKVWNGDAWNTITDDNNNLNVSDTPNSRSVQPRLVLDGNIPHITWSDVTMPSQDLIYYRWWNGSAWVTANGDTGPFVCSNDFTQTCTIATEQAYCGWYCDDNAEAPFGNAPCTTNSDCGTGYFAQCLHNQCQSIDVSVNWGMRWCSISHDYCYENADCDVGEGTCVGRAPGPNPPHLQAYNPDIDLFSNGTPGILYNDYARVYFRRWSGFNWTDMDADVDPFNHVMLNDNNEYTESVHSLTIDENDQPHASWTEADDAEPGVMDLRYLRWDNSQSDWLTASGSTSNEHDTPFYKVNSSPEFNSFGSNIALDQWNNVHLSWVDTKINPAGWTCGGFNSSSGYVNTPSRADAKELVLSPDNRYIFVAGQDNTDNNSDWNWRIEKRRADDSRLCTAANCGTAFDTDGIVRYDTDGSEIATDIAIDSTGENIYIVGRSESGRDLSIQKRNASTGALVTTFDGDGIITVSNTGTGTANHSNASIEIDGDYIYVIDTDEAEDWYIEKRLTGTGALVYDFGTQGVIKSIGGYGAQWITVEDNFMYVVGGDDSGDWRIEKRYLSSGSLVNQFANQGIYIGPGPGQSVDLYDSEVAFQTILSGDYLYVAGNSDDGTEEFLLAKFDKTTGGLETSFGNNGFLEIADYNAHKVWAITADADYIYFGGYTGDTDANAKWRMEKIDHNGNRPAGVINGGWNDGIIFEDGSSGHQNISGTIGGMVNDSNYIYAVGFRYFSPTDPSWRIEKRWKSTGQLDAYPQGISSLDCSDPQYPTCAYVWPDYKCIQSNAMYTRWTPGNVQGGIGWVEFMPAGALLGVPWVQTAFADIFGSEGVNLAPPPRGSGEYTATYLILSNGSIQGIPTNYNGNLSQNPTSQLYEFGLNPLIEGSSLPFGDNALSQINVDALITDQGDGKNRYGHDLITLSNSALNNPGSLGTDKILDNSVYYYNGNATVDDIIYIEKGDSTLVTPTAGDGLVVIDGDLEINQNIYYQKECSLTSTTSCVVDADCPINEICENLKLDAVTEMQSLAFIVRGNIYIDPFVTNVDSVLVALDDPSTLDISEGIISTSRKEPAQSHTDEIGENDTYINYDGAITYNTSPNDVILKFGQDSSAYQYRRRINIANQASVGSLDNFPLMVNINNTNDMWGHVTTADEVLFTDANGVALDFHFEKFDDTTDEAVAWVEVPELVADGNDYIYIYYDTASPTNMEDENATYDANYKAVYHLSDNATGAPDIDYVGHNSTQYSHEGLIQEFNGDEAINGRIGRGVYFDGSSNAATPPTGDYINLGPDILNGSEDFTVEAWVNVPTDPTPGTWDDYTGNIVQQRDSTHLGYDGSYQLFINDNWNGTWAGIDTSFGPTWTWSVPNSNVIAMENTGWHHVVAVQDNSINGGRIYVDGVERHTNSDGVADINGELYSFIGVDPYKAWSDPYQYDHYFLGSIDEITISDTLRSPGWIRASYLNGTNALVSGWAVEENIGSTTSMNRTYLRWAMGPNDELNIPPGSEIKNAYLELTGTGTSFGNMEARIYLIENDDLASLETFSAEALYKINVTNSVAYNTNIADWDESGVNKTPDLKSLVSRFIKSDEYVHNYNAGNPTHIGIAIQEDLATIGGIRQFQSAESPGDDSPKLVVEYSPQRKSFPIAGNANDVHAWTGGFANLACNIYGYRDATTFYRTYLRFPGIDLDSDVEILNANIRAYGCNIAGNQPLQMRQGLLSGYPNLSANPFDFSLDTATSEVSYDLVLNEMVSAGGMIILPDITKLANTFLARSDYDPTDVNFNSFIIRLRGGGDTIEDSLGVNQFRGIAQNNATLDVDYLVPLTVNGLMIGREFNFDRKYSRDLAPAERIVYDGRVLANTPPGLSDFTKTLPIYQRVAP